MALQAQVKKLNKTRASLDKALDAYAKWSIGDDGTGQQVVEGLLFDWITEAKNGNAACMKMLQPLLLPSPDQEEVWLPELANCETPAAMFTVIVQAVSCAQITPKTAETLASLVERQVRIINVEALAQEVERLRDEAYRNSQGLDAVPLEAIGG